VTKRVGDYILSRHRGLTLIVVSVTFCLIEFLVSHHFVRAIDNCQSLNDRHVREAAWLAIIK
jgi:hypothetical protein